MQRKSFKEFIKEDFNGFLIKKKCVATNRNGATNIQFKKTYKWVVY